MELRQLGRSGLRVSRLALGTMTWGRDTDEHEARDQVRAFLDAGGTLIDTADVYADGRSEEILGLARVAVLPRPGTTAAMILEGLSDRLTALKMPLIEISSTMIRERIQHGRSTRYIVPDAVGAYIKQHRLYTEVGDETLSSGQTTTQTA